MTEKSKGFSGFAIVVVGRNNYKFHSWGMAKSEALNTMETANLSEKTKQLWIWKK